MRDIRQDLNDRLTTIDAERSSLQERLSILDQEKALVFQMLELENSRWQKARSPTQGAQNRVDGPELSHYIMKLLADGREWRHGVIRDKAVSDGYLAESDSPGRAIHASLVNLKRQGVVEHVDTGIWKKATASKA